MPRSRTLSRALVAALAVAALAAPSALARPVPDQPVKNTQDLRMPDTRDASVQPLQDLRMPDTKDAATRPQAGTSSLAGTTSPPQRPVTPAIPDDDSSLPAIALVLAGLAVAGGGAGIATVARRRSRVTA